MPDFDIDFCQDGRDRVIEYVKTEYGADSVSQIATFGTMAAKAVVRDVGRVIEWNYSRSRRAREADPVPAGQANHARRWRARWSRGSNEREQSGTRKRARTARARRAARRPDAQRRHARGRRADRAGQAHRFLPALRGAGRGERGVAVRHEGRRSRRPGQIRLPRPDHAHHPRLDDALHPRARYGEPRPDFSLEAIPLDDPAIYQLFSERQHDGRVPVRIARHARPAEAGAARTASRTSSRWWRCTVPDRWT